MSTNYTNNTNKKRSSFTLIELLVVLALVAILSVVVVLTLNPAELIKQARDSNRLSDLSTINTALNLFSVDVASGFMGTSTIVYVSIPDNASSTCGSLGLPTLPTGWNYNCVTTANLRNTDGTGWIPVNFQRISSNSPISQLPIDPQNTTSTKYYTYVTGGSWKVMATPESEKYTATAGTDGGTNIGQFEVGNNMSLAPFLDGLVGWWKFDGDANDSSGFGNNGTNSSASFVSGRVGQSANFSGSAQYITFSPPSAQNYSVCFWSRRVDDFAQKKILQIGSGTPSGQAIYIDTCFSGPQCIRSYLGAGNCQTGTMGGTFPVATWTYVCLINNYNVSGKMFINSALITQASNICSGYSGSTSYASYSDATGINGQIDDLRIYNRALSTSEISALYNSAR